MLSLAAILAASISLCYFTRPGAIPLQIKYFPQVLIAESDIIQVRGEDASHNNPVALRGFSREGQFYRFSDSRGANCHAPTHVTRHPPPSSTSKTLRGSAAFIAEAIEFSFQAKASKSN
jgi:hypothetical protein